MKKELTFTIFSLTLILLTSLTLAKIEITQPLDTYNLGDRIPITVTLTPTAVTGNFEINLVCQDNTETVYKISPAEGHFTSSEQQKINHQLILEPQYIQELLGECTITTSLGEESASTSPFTISSGMNLIATLDKDRYDPDETITLTIEATKDNSKPLKGFVEISGVYNANIEISGVVTESFQLNPETEPGTYNLEIFAYDKSTQILNQENTSVSFKINQIPSFVQISLPNIEANPEEDFTISADIYDQSGKSMDGTLSFLLISPKDEESTFTLQSGDFHTINLPTNATHGTYTLQSSFQDISQEEEFVAVSYTHLRAHET